MEWADHPHHSTLSGAEFDAYVLHPSDRFIWYVSGAAYGIDPPAMGAAGSLDDAKREAQAAVERLEIEGVK